MEMLEDNLSSPASQASSLVKSFWAGKLLSKLRDTDDPHTPGTHKYVASTTSELCTSPSPSRSPSAEEQSVSSLRTDALYALSVKETSLSPGVHNLLTIPVSNEEITEFNHKVDKNSILDARSATLNWKTLARYLLGEPSSDWSVFTVPGAIATGAKKCKVLAHIVYQKINRDGRLSAILRDTSLFSWTSQPQELTDCIHSLLSPPLEPAVSSPLTVNVCLLKLTSVLERSLGDVFLVTSREKVCPFLLRDLLVKKELVALSPVAMYLLQCLMGPPAGLNLRNLCWHGFLQHDEVPISLVVFLLVIAASLGTLWPEAILSELSAARRPFTNFSPQEARLRNVFPDLSSSGHALHDILADSFFVLPSMLVSWEAGLEAFFSHHYGECVMLLLPCLEHSLRRVFACINHCPQRIVTAEAHTLYTTLDEILSPVLPDQRGNELMQELGQHKIEMLLDLLVHPEGPRLRDKISHGEVLFGSVTKVMANHLLAVCGLFCSQFTLGTLLNHLVQPCLQVGTSYSSFFHPLSLLREELEECQDSLNQLKCLPFHEQPSTSESVSESASKAQGSLVAMAGELTSRLLLDIFREQPVPDRDVSLTAAVPRVWSSLTTLYAPRQQLELTARLRRIVEHSCTAIRQIRETAIGRNQEQQRKELRSRQRANYLSLLASLSLYEASMSVLLALVVHTLSRVATPPPDYHHHTTIKFHKKVLQFTENFCSQTSPLKNRWLEACQLCHTFLTLVQQNTK